MKPFLPAACVFAVAAGFGIWSNSRSENKATSRVGTHPGGVGPGKVLPTLQPAPGDRLVGFSSGCFWGAEEAFRKMPGLVSTAVGYTGGTSSFPSEAVAHRTGHLETVLVEFDPHKTPFSALLKSFWSLPRSSSLARAAIWTYGADEEKLAEASKAQQEKELGHKLRVRIGTAAPFYLAEDFHQQYDEKAGKELCPTEP